MASEASARPPRRRCPRGRPRPASSWATRSVSMRPGSTMFTVTPSRGDLASQRLEVRRQRGAADVGRGQRRDRLLHAARADARIRPQPRSRMPGRTSPDQATCCASRRSTARSASSAVTARRPCRAAARRRSAPPRRPARRPRAPPRTPVSARRGRSGRPPPRPPTAAHAASFSTISPRRPATTTWAPSAASASARRAAEARVAAENDGDLAVQAQVHQPSSSDVGCRQSGEVLLEERHAASGGSVAAGGRTRPVCRALPRRRRISLRMARPTLRPAPRRWPAAATVPRRACAAAKPPAACASSAARSPSGWLNPVMAPAAPQRQLVEQADPAQAAEDRQPRRP